MTFSIKCLGTSLVAQWLRICPLMQGSIPGLETIIRSQQAMGLLSPCATAREVQSLQQRAHVRHEDPLQPSTYIQTSQACSSKESTCQCRRCEFDPWVGKILWSRKWQSTPMDRGAWIKGLTTENAYLLMSFGFVISLRVSGCLK